MIEKLVAAQSLDNDVAVMKIVQLMGQLSPKDLGYILAVANQVHRAIAEDIDGRC
jgi:hypothetical protein